jgi:hypothetical protein
MSANDELSALTRATRVTTREAIEDFARRTMDVLTMFNISHAATEAIARGHFELPGGPAMEPLVRPFALAQMEQGYPLVVQQALVTLWGTVESTMESVCRAWAIHDPNVLRGKAFSKLKVSVAEFLSLEEEDQIALVLDQLDRSFVESVPAGISRIEAVLAALGLDGVVDPGVKKTLIELYQVRNLYVHNGGVADHRFKRTCPWRKEAVGDPVYVATSQVGEYELAVAKYVRGVADRLAKATVKTPAHLLYPGAIPQWQEARTPPTGFESGTGYTFTTADAPSVVERHYRGALSHWHVAGSEQTSERVALLLRSPDDSERLGVAAESMEGGATKLTLVHYVKDSPSTKSLGDSGDSK